MCPRQCAHTQAHTHRTSPRCDTQPAACATEMLYAHEFYWDRHKARSSTLVRGAVDLTPTTALLTRPYLLRHYLLRLLHAQGGSKCHLWRRDEDWPTVEPLLSRADTPTPEGLLTLLR